VISGHDERIPLNSSITDMPILDEVPDDLKLAGDLNKLNTELNQFLHECTNTYTI